MKILYITARQPYPVIKGDQIIAYEQIKELSKKNEVYLITFFKDEIDKKNLLDEMNKYCKKIYCYKHTSINKVFSMLKVIINLKPIQMNMFYRFDIKKKINNIYNEINPDVVHVQSFRMAEYFLGRKIRKSIDLIDSYSENMRKRAEGSKLLKTLWYLEYKLLVRYEEKLISDFPVKTLVSERDKVHFKDKSIAVNYNGTSISMNEAIPYRNDIIIQGNMSYFPNVEAVEYIKNELLEELKIINRDIKLYIVGGNPCAKVKSLNNDKDVIVTGYVRDMEEYLHKCKVAIYPIFSATGMQNKVLESMAAGVPCIISEECLKGIPGLVNNKNVLVAKTKDEYINLYKKLITNKDFYMNIRKDAYKFVSDNYSWQRNCNKLIKLWDHI